MASPAIEPGTHPWRNSVNYFDVNNDGIVSPIDAVQVINALIVSGPRPLSDPPVEPDVPPPFLDVKPDGQLSALDALQVINELIARGSLDGSGVQARIWSLTAQTLASLRLPP